MYRYQIANVLIERIIQPSIVNEFFHFNWIISRENNRASHFTWILFLWRYQYSGAWNRSYSEINKFIYFIYSCDLSTLFRSRFLIYSGFVLHIRGSLVLDQWRKWCNQFISDYYLWCSYSWWYQTLLRLLQLGISVSSVLGV